jgi:YgiT-type zinc finger domain-containing protein
MTWISKRSNRLYSKGDFIEDYPTDPRGPSCLVGGTARAKPIHVVLGWAREKANRTHPQDDHCVYPAASEMDGPSNKRSQAMRTYADCTVCGGEVEERHINYDYRCRDHMLVLRNVPAGICLQCGEKYFTPDVLKRMDFSFHNIFERDQQPDQVLDVPAVNF